MTLGIERSKILLFALMALMVGFALSACGGGGGGGGGVGDVGDLIIEMIADAGGDNQTVLSDSLPLLGFSATATGHDQRIQSLTFDVTGNFPDINLAGVNFYLVGHGNNGVLQTTKTLLAPTAGGDDIVYGAPTNPVVVDLDNRRITFNFAAPGLNIDEDSTLFFTVFADFDDNNPPGVGDTIGVLLRAVRSRSTNGFGIDEHWDGDIGTGEFNGGQFINVIGALVVGEGSANADGANPTYVYRTDTLTDAQFSLRLTAFGEDIAVSSITIPMIGTLDESTYINTGGVQIGLDTNSDGVIDAAFGGAVANFAGSDLVITGLSETIIDSFNGGNPEEWVVTLPLIGDASTAGLTVICRTDDGDDFVATGLDSGEVIPVDLNGDGDVIFNEVGDSITGGTSRISGELTVGFDGPVLPQAGNVLANTTNTPVAHIYLTASNTGGFESIEINQLQFSAVDNVANAILDTFDDLGSSVRLWRGDGDNVFEPSGDETALSTVALNGSYQALFTSGIFATLAPGGTVDFWVSVNLTNAPAGTFSFTYENSLTRGLGQQSSLILSVPTGADQTFGNQTVIPTVTVSLDVDEAGVDDDVVDCAESDDNNLAVLDLNVACDSAGPVTITQFTVNTNYGGNGVTFADGNIADVLVAVDSNNDGATDVFLGGQASFVGGVGTFDIPDTVIAASSSISVILQLNLFGAGTPADGGATFQAYIDSADDIDTNLDPNVNYAFGAPAPNGAVMTMIGRLAGAASATQPGANPEFVGMAEPTVNVLSINFAAVDEAIGLTQVVVNNDQAADFGTIASLLDPDVASAVLYRDANANGVFNPGTDISVASGVASATSITFGDAVNVFATVPEDSNLDFFVVLSFNGNLEDDEIQLVYDASETLAKGGRSNKDIVDTGAGDFTGNLFILKPFLLVARSASDSTNNPSFIFNDGDNVQAAHFMLTTDMVSSVEVATFKVRLSTLGTGFTPTNDIDAGSVELWLGDGAGTPTTRVNDNAGPTDFVLLAPNTWEIDFVVDAAEVVVTSAAPKELIVIFDMGTADAASGGEMFQLSVADEADVTVTDNELIVLAPNPNEPICDSFMIQGYLTVAAGTNNNSDLRNDGTDDLVDALPDVDGLPDNGHHRNVLHFTLTADNAESIDMDTLDLGAILGNSFDAEAHVRTFTLWRSAAAGFDSSNQDNGGAPVATNDDVVVDSAVFSAGVLAFDFSGQTIANNETPVNFYVSMNMLDDGLDFAVNSDSIQLTLGTDDVSGTGSGSSRTLTDSVNSVNGGTHTVHSYVRFVKGNQNHSGVLCYPYDRDTEFLVLHFDAKVDNAGSVTLTSVRVDEDGAVNLFNGSVIEAANSVIIYMDSNNDGMFQGQGTETVFGMGNFPADDAEFTINGNQTISGTKAMFIAVDPIAMAAISTNTIELFFDSAADFTVTGPAEAQLDGDDDWIASLGGGSGETNQNPADNIRNDPIRISGNLDWDATSYTTQNFAQSDLQDVFVYGIEATADGENYNVTGLTIKALGTVNEMTDLGTVSVYADTDGDGVPDTAALDSDVFNVNDGTIAFTFAAQTVADTMTVGFIVTADMNGMATAGETIRMTIEAKTNVTAQGQLSLCPGEMTGTFPANGGTCTVISQLQVAAAATMCNPTHVIFDATDRPILALDVTAQSGDARMTGITFTQSGNTDESTTINRYRLWQDNGDGIFNSTNDTLIATVGGTANDGDVVFAGMTYNITGGQTKLVWLTARLIGGAGTIGETIITTLADDDADIEGIDILSTQDLDRDDTTYATASLYTYGSEDNSGAEYDSVSGDLAIGSGTLTITGRLTVGPSPQHPAPENWAHDTMNVPLAVYRMTCTGEDFDFFDAIVTMNVNVLALTDFAAGNFHLWVDVDNDGEVSAGDEDLGVADTYNNGTGEAEWIDKMSANSLVQPGALGFVDFLVTVNLPGVGPATNPLKQIWANLVGDACNFNVYMTGATSASDVPAIGAYPISGNAQTIVGDLEFTINDVAATMQVTCNDEAELLVLDLTVNPNQEDIEINRLIFNDVGTAHNANDIASATVYWEVDDASGFDGTEAILAIGTYPAEGAPLVLGDVNGGAGDLNFVVDDALTYRFYLVYELSGAAGNKDRTFDPELQTDTNVNATGVVTGRPNIIEAPGDTFPLENTSTFMIQTCLQFSVASISPLTRRIDPDTNATFEAPLFDPDDPGAGAPDTSSQDFRGALLCIKVDKDNSGPASFDGLTLNFGGDLADADFTDVVLQLDGTAGTNDFDIAADNTDMTDDADDGAPTAGSLAVTLSDGDGDWTIPGNVAVTQYWWVVVELAGSASPGETLTVSVVDESALTFTTEANGLILEPFGPLAGATATVDVFHREFLGHGSLITHASTAGVTLNQPVKAVAANFDTQNLGATQTQDMMVINFGSDNISYPSGQGDGTFFNDSTNDPFNDAGETGAWGAAAGDLDNDGDIDLMVTNSTSPATGTASIYFLDGANDLNTTAVFTMPTSSPAFGLCLGDFDNDGDLDGITALQFIDRIQAVGNNNDGTFSPAPGAGHDLPAAMDGPIDVHCADLNCDGNLDVIVLGGNAGQPSFCVVFGDGDLTFTNGSVFPTSAQNRDFACGDYDGDGYLDVIVLHDATLDIFLGDGTGDFTVLGSGALASGQTAARSIATGDFDRDGLLDVVIGDGTNSADSTYLFPGTGDFFLLQLLPGENPQTIQDILVADFDNDGWDDLATVERNSNTMSIFLNNGRALSSTITLATEFSGPAHGANNSQRCPTYADLDCDGDLDVAVLTTGTGTLDAWANDGSADYGLTPAKRTPLLAGLNLDSTAGWRGNGMAIADFNNDGKPDFVVGEGADQEFRIILNTTTVADTLTVGDDTSIGTGADVLDVIAVDVNLDGDMDVVVLTAAGISIFTNDGDYTSITAPGFSLIDTAAGNANGILLLAGDLDVDGDVDIVVVRANGIDTYANDGAGAFADNAEADNANGVPTGGKLGDFNRDGLLDVVIFDDTNDSIEFFLSQGNTLDDTMFVTPGANEMVALGSAVNTGLDVAVGDVNKDGILDIVTSGLTANNLVFLIDPNGDGDWSDAVETSIVAPLSMQSGLHLHDYDGDGDLDLIGFSTGLTVTIMENTTVDN